MAGLVLLSLLLLAGCGLLEEWASQAGPDPAPQPEDYPEPPSCPSSDCPECPPPDSGVSGSLLEPSFKEQHLVELINEYRQGQGLGLLEWNSQLYIA
ncbi:MAG: hypothetical protein ACE5LD_05800, partial [Candidatus Bipolaricaulia bacterium]